MTNREVFAMKITTTLVCRLLTALAVLGAALAVPNAARAHDGKEHAARWQGGNDYQRSVRTYAVPDVELTDADARPVRLRELLAGRDPVMMNFIFTTCATACPVMVKVFSDVPSRMGVAAKNLRMISISIDPDHDTPAQLKSFAQNFGAGVQWTFLTGRMQDVKAVQLAFDSYRGDKMNHEPLTLMRQAAAKSWVRIDGFANPDELVREYQKVVPQ
jgi:protein SCO1